MKVFVIKVYEGEVDHHFASLTDEQLKLISYQEFNLKSTTPKRIQTMMADWSRYFNNQRED